MNARDPERVLSWLRFRRPMDEWRPVPTGVEPGARTPDGSGRTGFAPEGGPVSDALHDLYERYCAHESRELLTLMPRDAFRELYREARRRAQEGNDALRTALDEGGPMELAARLARDRLPLPPYEVWVNAYLENRRAFLDRLEIDAAPSREEPVTVFVRPVGDDWYAGLCVGRCADGWSGRIRFHRSESARAWTTSAVFRGDDIDEIRDRFRSFDDNTLRAFLRSVLP